jgi:hypothetical protein
MKRVAAPRLKHLLQPSSEVLGDALASRHTRVMHLSSVYFLCSSFGLAARECGASCTKTATTCYSIVKQP